MSLAVDGHILMVEDELMKITHFKAVVAVLGLVAIILWLFVPFCVLGQGGAELICEPNRGSYGLQIFLKGNGFAPNSQIQIEAFGQTIAPQSDNTGQFMVIAFAPTDETKFKPGEYTLTARDSTGTTAEAIFTLEALQTIVRPTKSAGPTSAIAQPTPPPPAGSPDVAATATQLVPGGVITPTPAGLVGGLWVPNIEAIVIFAGVVGLLLLAVVIFFTLARRKEPTCPPGEQAGARQAPRPRPAESARPSARPATTTPAAQESGQGSEPLQQGETTLVMPTVPKLSSRPTLQIIEGEGEGTVFSLDQKTTVIGRGEDCDIVINHPMVSRHHAKIVRVGPSFYIHDLQSTNGTMVNGENIDQHVLQPEDEIQIGVTLLLFQQPKVE